MFKNLKNPAGQGDLSSLLKDLVYFGVIACVRCGKEQVVESVECPLSVSSLLVTL